jgi:hypothetical protein
MRSRRPAALVPESGPVVVGGIGGSGTRVVAEVLRALGMYIGTDLNDASDNLWFTMLCKLPRWDLGFDTHDAPRVSGSLELLERAMTGRLVPDRADREEITAIVERCLARSAEDPLPDDVAAAWYRQRRTTLRGSRRQVPTDARQWGWKEPNSHFFLPHLRRFFGERLRYVHVIRNGFSMAHSKNQAQLLRWGPTLGFSDARSRSNAVTSLDFWIVTNELVLAQGAEMGADSFLVVNYDELCAEPRSTIERLLRFLALDPPGDLRREVEALAAPARPLDLTSQDVLREFGEMRLARVRDLGFTLPGEGASDAQEAARWSDGASSRSNCR